MDSKPKQPGPEKAVYFIGVLAWLIPGAGHNDLMLVGEAQYFEAIRTFVLDCSGGKDP